MCGFAGFVGGEWDGRAKIAAVLGRMNRSIAHRGPDHSDVWIDEEARVGFAHNRLAILDLSPAGNQPMASPSGRYVDRLQWRNLQSPGDPRRARASGTGPGVEGPFGYRIPARGDRLVGHPRRARAVERHVRVRLVGPVGAHPDSRPRPARREAALLWTAGSGRAVPVRIGAQGACRSTRSSDPMSTAAR